MTSSKDDPDPEMANGDVSPRSAPDNIPQVVINGEESHPQEESEDKKSIHKEKEEDGKIPDGLIHQNGKTQYAYDEDNDYFSEYGTENEHNLLPGGEFQSTFSINDLPNGVFSGEAIADHLPIPPDGGYGWVIVMAAFLCNFFVDGIANSFGAFMGSFEEVFKSTKATTSLIGSLLIGAYLLSGPIAGGLLNKYDARTVVIAGTILSSLCFIVSTFFSNIIIFYIVYSLLGGIGFGFIYLPAIVVVSQYFESKRALATGIAVAGSGFGTFVMPSVCTFCIEHLGWKPTIYILAGLLLICILCALIYKPLPVPEFNLEEKKQLEELQKQQTLFAKLSRMELGDSEINEETRPTSQNSIETEGYPKRASRTVSACTEREDGLPLLQNELAQREETDATSPTAPPSRNEPLSPILEGRQMAGQPERPISKSRTGSSQHYDRYPGGVAPRTRKQTITSITSELTSASRQNLNSQLMRVSARSYAQSLSRLSQAPQSIKAGDSMLSIALSGVDPKEFARPMSRRDIFLQGSIKNLKEFQEEGGNFKSYRESQISIPAAVVAQSLSSMSQAGGDIAELSSRMGGSRYSRIGGGADEEDLGFYVSMSQAGGDIAELSSRMGGSRYSRIGGGADEEDLGFYVEEDDSKCKWIPLSIRNALSEMIDLNLLKEPIMILLVLSNIMGMLGFYVPFVYIFELAKERNCSGSTLLSLIGITNTFGRIFFGWMADRRWVTALAINNFSLIFCGVLTAICPLCWNFTTLAIYSCLFGFIVSAYICLTSIVLSDLLGVERLTNSFGLLVLGRGIAALLGTPLAGMIYDFTTSYDICFIFAGVLIVIAGGLSCVIPFAHRYQRSLMKNEGDYEEPIKELDLQSGKLSVLTEENEDNLTEYQRTIQSIKQQRQLFSELEEARRKQMNEETVDEVNEEEHEEKSPNGHIA
uniref:Major facilitator superfamily (MFS) profile domain-containing protein n=1 Tax=Acrobeloides nanus TaxID=290746 RepID=A0A914BUX7_9BILA